MAERFFSDQWSRLENLHPALASQVQIERQREGGQPVYVLTDPLAGKSHRLGLGAMSFVRHLDGERSINEIWEACVDSLEQDAPSQGDIVRLLAQLHQADLIRGDVPADIVELSERGRKQSSALLKQNLLGPMMFRLPLFDPDRFLEVTFPLIRPLVSWFGFVAWLCLISYAGVLAIMESATLVQAWSDLAWNASSIALVAVVYVLLKTLHELGHGWVAKRFGAPVHEVGIMFLVFMPVPYVDASEAGALPGRHRRAAVAAAGIIVETALAALAFLAWREMEPGPWRAAAYNLMLIGGISTVFVNGNPLLRFDGYYVFSDLIGIPNLAPRANRFWAEITQNKIFGAKNVEIHPATRFERVVYVIYAPAAFIYRLAISLTIALFVAQKAFFIGVLLAVWTMLMGFGRPIGKAIWTLLTAPKLQRVRTRAVLTTCGGFFAALSLLFLIPAPHSSKTFGVVWIEEDAAVRSSEAGQIAEVFVNAGQAVSAGSPLLRLADPFREARREALKWKLVEAKVAYAQTRALDAAAAALAKIAVQEAEQALQREDQRSAGNVIRAKLDGVFMPDLPVSDLSGRWLSQGQSIGYVLPDRPERVRVVVKQDAIDAVSTGIRRAWLRSPGRSKAILAESIGAISGGGFTLPSPALGLAAGGNVPTDPRDNEGRRAMERIFQFDVVLPDSALPPKFGTRVAVRLVHESSPIGPRIYDTARRIFLSTFNV